MVELTPGTRKRLEMLFVGEECELAASVLETECADNLPFCDAEDRGPLIERIRIAVLKLSEGKLDKLEHSVREAQTDWRDVLVAAGFGDDVAAHLAWWPDADVADPGGNAGLI